MDFPPFTSFPVKRSLFCRKLTLPKAMLLHKIMITSYDNKWSRKSFTMQMIALYSIRKV